MGIWKINCWFLVDILRTITVQSFVVVALLVLELAGGGGECQYDTPGTNVSENTLGF